MWIDNLAALRYKRWRLNHTKYNSWNDLEVFEKRRSWKDQTRRRRQYRPVLLA